MFSFIRKILSIYQSGYFRASLIAIYDQMVIIFSQIVHMSMSSSYDILSNFYLIKSVLSAYIFINWPLELLA
jgi:hypothetical protein